MPEERWPPTPIRMKSSRRRIDFEGGYGYASKHWPEREDSVKMHFKSQDEYEDFILGEAERIRSERDAASSSVEAAD